MSMFSDGSDTEHYRNIVECLEEKIAKLNKRIKELEEENEELDSILAAIRDGL